MTPRRNYGRKGQRGAAAVEFALVAGVFFSLLIGVMEMGRLLFYWNTAAEATRLGARIAVVCDVHDGIVKTKMNALFPVIPVGKIEVAYLPNGCEADDNCAEVTVRVLPGITIDTAIPYVPLKIPMPGFATTLTRESLSSASNPVCT